MKINFGGNDPGKKLLLLIAAILTCACDGSFKKGDENPRVVYTDTYIVRDKSKIDEIVPLSVEKVTPDGKREPIVINAEELVIKDGGTLFIEDRDVTFNVKRVVSENGTIATFDDAFPEPKPIAPGSDYFTSNIEIFYGKSGGKITINTIDAEGTLNVKLWGWPGRDGDPQEVYEFYCGFDTPCPKPLDGQKGADGIQQNNKCIKQPEDGTDGFPGLRGRPGYDGGAGGASGNGNIIITGANTLKIQGTVIPGEGGIGGKGMLGQLGGRGGPPGTTVISGGGFNTTDVCRTAHWGRDGKQGEPGADGKKGAQGAQGKFCLIQNGAEQNCIAN